MAHDLIFNLKAEIAKFKSDMDGAAAHLTKNVQKMGHELEGLHHSFQEFAGFELAEKMFEGMGEVIQEITAAETIVKTLEQTLATTGKSAQMSVAGVSEMAQALSEMTGVDDEPIMQLQSTLLSFGNVGPGVLQKASMAALDLSAKFNVDLTTAAQKLGKALNDPAQGLGRLEQMGAHFTDSQKEVVKALAESGQMLEAQQMILDAVGSAAGGTATVIRNSVPGAWQALGTAAGNVLQKLGEMPGLMQTIRGAIEFSITAFNKAEKAIGGFWKALDPKGDFGQKFANELGMQFAHSFDALTTMAHKAATVIAGFMNPKYWYDGGTQQIFKNAAAIEQHHFFAEMAVETGEKMKQMDKATTEAHKHIQVETGITIQENEKLKTSHKTTAESTKTEYEKMRKSLEELAKTDIGSEFRLNAMKQEESAVKTAKQTLLGYVETLHKMGSSAAGGILPKAKDGSATSFGVVAQAENYTKQIKQMQEMAERSQKVQEKFNKMADVGNVKQQVQYEMQLFETAQKMEKQLDALHHTSGKFTGTLTEGLVTANAHGSAQEQMWYRIAQSIGTATGAVTQYAGAVARVGGGAAGSYLAKAAGGGMKAGDIGAVQVGGGGYAFSPAAAAAHRSGSIESGPAANVNNFDLPMGATFNVAPEHRARGGDVRGGQPYKVGEFGEELFVPGMDGAIVPKMSGPAQRKKAAEMSAVEVTRMLDHYNWLKKAETDRQYAGPDGQLSAFQYGLNQGRFKQSYGRGASFGGPVGMITDSMLDELFNAGMFGEAMAIGGHASGGPTLVGEKGPELLDLPSGARITPNNQLQAAPPSQQVFIRTETVEPLQVQQMPGLGNQLRIAITDAVAAQTRKGGTQTAARGARR